MRATPADIQDHDIIEPLLAMARRRGSALSLAVAGGGYKRAAEPQAVRADADLKGRSRTMRTVRYNHNRLSRLKNFQDRLV